MDVPPKYPAMCKLCTGKNHIPAQQVNAETLWQEVSDLKKHFTEKGPRTEVFKALNPTSMSKPVQAARFQQTEHGLAIFFCKCVDATVGMEHTTKLKTLKFSPCGAYVQEKSGRMA